MIDRFATTHPTWLLFDADWAHTKQSTPYMAYCAKIVSVGRVKWIEGSKMTGKDNCAWYLFDKSFQGVTEFHGQRDFKLSNDLKGQAESCPLDKFVYTPKPCGKPTLRLVR
jgi:hypothetical protein